jgi:hypothetical protein
LNKNKNNSLFIQSYHIAKLSGLWKTFDVYEKLQVIKYIEKKLKDKDDNND